MDTCVYSTRQNPEYTYCIVHDIIISSRNVATFAFWYYQFSAFCFWRVVPNDWLIIGTCVGILFSTSDDCNSGRRQCNDNIIDSLLDDTTIIYSLLYDDNSTKRRVFLSSKINLGHSSCKWKVRDQGEISSILYYILQCFERFDISTLLYS